MHQTVSVETTSRVTVEDVTADVRERIPTDFDSGLCTVFVRHTTTGITVNEAEERLLDDLESALADLVPTDEKYRHDQIDDNADSHLRSMLLGSSVAIPVTDGRLDLGTWQSILLVEADGPRTRTLTVSFVSSS
jgi:secondary thiamine-phosphate synthase enzyme